MKGRQSQVDARRRSPVRIPKNYETRTTEDIEGGGEPSLTRHDEEDVEWEETGTTQITLIGSLATTPPSSDEVIKLNYIKTL